MILYIDENEDDMGRRDRLVASVRRHCVDLPLFLDIPSMGAMLAWCTDHIGPRRPHHPISEAESGWLDYFEGDWAVERLVDDHGDNVVSFWFARLEDQTLFKLAWLGDAP